MKLLSLEHQTRVDEELLQNSQKLKVVGRAGAGIDNLDESYLAQRGTEIINAPEGNRNAVGEHSVGLILSLFNNICKAHNEVKSGIWQREPNRGLELSGKTIGIIGYGNTGSAFGKGCL